jgi:nucleotide-binding universal stress UspA family protein
MRIGAKRPRELHWYHAGPMLFGDWGTSRLYVLGLAFYYTQRSSLWFMLAMSLLLVAVGWAYQVICRVYPDGGGVYSSARHRSQLLAIVGGLLLCADYLVTAAISSLDAFHYLNVSHPATWAAASIAAMGCINYFGPRKSGILALFVALLTVLLSIILAAAALPSLDHAQIERPPGTVVNWWTQFTSLILAISGVEAIANMTGIMVRPVERTVRRSVWPVLIEIVVLNIVLTLAMLAIPLAVVGDGDVSAAHIAHRDDMLRLMAEYFIGPGFAAASSFVFALLLFSAANTALTDLVSIQFMMAHDKELPSIFAFLNRWGMPAAPLLLATVLPALIVVAVPDVGQLADLYAIGVVGAVAINLGTCSTNSQITLGRFERGFMLGLAVLMVGIWMTIAYEKPHALLFAMSILGAGLVARSAVHHRALLRTWMLAEVDHPLLVRQSALAPSSLPAPAAARKPVAPKPRQGRILVATRGNMKLFRFALEEARSRQAELLILFVRHIAVPTLGPASVADINTDAEALAFFDQIDPEAAAAAVSVHCLYAVGDDVPDTILEFATTHAVDVLILGASQRGALWHVMKGDVLQEVAQYLPERIDLLIHA